MRDLYLFFLRRLFDVMTSNLNFMIFPAPDRPLPAHERLKSFWFKVERAKDQSCLPSMNPSFPPNPENIPARQIFPFDFKKFFWMIF